MKSAIMSVCLMAMTGAAWANGPVPTTTSPEERERHEFIDAQRGIRSGVSESTRGEFITAVATGYKYKQPASAPWLRRGILPAQAYCRYVLWRSIPKCG